MKILVLTIADMTNLNRVGLYQDLFNQISKSKKIDILTLSDNEEIVNFNKNINVYPVKAGKIFNTNKISKAINLLSLNRKFKKVIKKDLRNNHYDLILYNTPPITLNSAIKYAKHKYKAKSYLLLKDIFPQNAVDLNMFSKKGLIYKYFRKKEKNLYKISDYIGTMSKGNLSYVLNNNVDQKNLEVNPNSIQIRENKKISIEKKQKILRRYKLPLTKPLFIYGGNLGVPQGMSYIKGVISENERLNNHIVIVGDGTEKNNLIKFINENKIINTSYINKLPKEEYDLLLNACDVGLIFLDNRFTIPNIPSRLLSYLDYNKPVIAATDPNTDLKDIIEEGQFGYWCESTDPQEMIKLFEKIKEEDNIERLGKNGRKYLENNYDVKISAKLILDKLKEGE